MSDFNLRHLVRDVQASSELTDPHALADEILDRIDDCDLRPALGQVLTGMVREEIRISRNGGLPPLPSAPLPSPKPAGPRLTLHTQPQVMTESPVPVVRSTAKKPPTPTPARPPGYSAKVAAIRAAGPKWLGHRLHTSADPREWKQIGDCSFSDLMFAVRQRREQAARTTAKADWFENLAELVHAHGVGRVRDLPASVLAEAGGAAA
ncbi:hypothetical protein ACGFX8_32975 [Streptomyces sp. NPDC048362]|uniref:hypothetical protein n=1 Tax=Streptomyces sp. NPDC048362 TaxID=3365539 RepID=UPI0037151E3C